MNDETTQQLLHFLMEQNQNLTILLHEQNQTIQQLNSTVLQLTSPPVPLTLQENNQTLLYHEEDDLKDAIELVGSLGEDPEFDDEYMDQIDTEAMLTLGIVNGEQ
jgi:hypothetical protein